MASTDITKPAVELPEPSEPNGEPPRQKAVTIGSVCKALHQEFPDISISKIRYLEDQKLLEPPPHPGRLPALHSRATSSGCGRSCAFSGTSSCPSG